MTGLHPGDCEGAGAGRKVAPGAATPALAWVEHEALLPAQKAPKSPPPAYSPPVKVKTKFQLRRDKLLDLLTPPYFTLCMIVIMLCVSWWGGSAGAARLQWSRLQWAPHVWRHEPWRLLTYSALHASGDHLAINALVAAFVAWRLEREQAWWRVALVWGGGAVGGALGAGALQPRERVVGASAAVYALLTAHLPNVCLRFGHVPLWWFRPLSVLVLSASDVAWWAAGGWAGGAARAGGAGVVAWSAHALGALVGLLLGFLVFTGERSGSRAVLACRVTSGFALLALATAAGLYYGYLDTT